MSKKLDERVRHLEDILKASEGLDPAVLARIEDLTVLEQTLAIHVLGYFMIEQRIIHSYVDDPPEVRQRARYKHECTRSQAEEEQRFDALKGIHKLRSTSEADIKQAISKFNPREIKVLNAILYDLESHIRYP